MAFSYAQTRRTVIGNIRLVTGTWNAASVTSGNIVTGLNSIYFSDTVNKVSENDNAKIDDSTTAGTMAITGVTSNDTGTWIAFGR